MRPQLGDPGLDIVNCLGALTFTVASLTRKARPALADASTNNYYT